MIAVILCAGYATRMYPLTKDQPKPLLPLAGKPLLDYIVEQVFKVADVTHVAVVSNARFFPQFEQWQRQHPERQRIVILNDGSTSEADRLGAVGDLLFALTKLGVQEDVLMIAGDNYFQFPLRALVNAGQNRQASVIALRDLQDKAKVAGKFGVAIVDASNRIVGFEEKPQNPKSTLASTACYLLTKNALHALQTLMTDKQRIDNLGTFIAWLAKEQEVYGFIFTEAWHDIGSLEEYHSLNDKLTTSS